MRARIGKAKKNLIDGQKRQMSELISAVSGLPYLLGICHHKSVHGQSADGDFEGFDGGGRDRKHSQSGPETIGPACKPEYIV